MTTTLTPDPLVDVLELDPLRLLPITANLLPPEITDARRAKKVRRVMAVVVCVAVVATGGWYAWTKHGTSQAQDSLTSAQDRSLALGHRAASYNNLVKIQSQTSAISAELTTLMADDLPWWQLLPSLSAIAPAGVALTGVTGSISPAGAAPAAAAAQPVATGAPSIGSFTIIGTAPDKNSIAAFVDALALVKGISNPYLTGAQSQSGSGLQFTVQAQITKTALGGRFASPTATSTGGH
jgi:hypothetical protein